MTSDDARSAPDRAFRHPGPGMPSWWTCGACGKRQSVQFGRGLRRVGGIKTWVCVLCKDKVKT